MSLESPALARVKPSSTIAVSAKARRADRVQGVTS